MADVKRINGYNVKDSDARNSISKIARVFHKGESYTGAFIFLTKVNTTNVGKAKGYAINAILDNDISSITFSNVTVGEYYRYNGTKTTPSSTSIEVASGMMYATCNHNGSGYSANEFGQLVIVGKFNFN